MSYISSTEGHAPPVSSHTCGICVCSSAGEYRLDQPEGGSPLTRDSHARGARDTIIDKGLKRDITSILAISARSLVILGLQPFGCVSQEAKLLEGGVVASILTLVLERRFSDGA